VEWLDPINQSCANPFVRNAARGEFLAESDYWVVQKYSDDSFEKG
jgi:hypothetical protein